MVLLLASRGAVFASLIWWSTLRAAPCVRLGGIPTLRPPGGLVPEGGVRATDGGRPRVRRRGRRLGVRRLGHGVPARAVRAEGAAPRARAALGARVVPTDAVRVCDGDLGPRPRVARAARRLVVPRPRSARLERARGRFADLRERPPAEGGRVVQGAAGPAEPVAVLVQRPRSGLRRRREGERGDPAR